MMIRMVVALMGSTSRVQGSPGPAGSGSVEATGLVRCPSCGGVLGVQAEPGFPVRHLDGSLEEGCWSCTLPLLLRAMTSLRVKRGVTRVGNVSLLGGRS